MCPYLFFLRDGKKSMSDPNESGLNKVDRLSIFVGEKISIVFLISVVFTAYEVIMRYVFNAPTIWVHDSAAALSATGFLMAGTYALQADRHMRISVVYDVMPKKIQRVLDFVQHIFIIGFMTLFTYACWKQAVPAVNLMETSAHAWDVPIPAYLKSLMVLASGLMLVQALSQLIHDIKKIREAL